MQCVITDGVTVIPPGVIQESGRTDGKVKTRVTPVVIEEFDRRRQIRIFDSLPVARLPADCPAVVGAIYGDLPGTSLRESHFPVLW